MKTSRLPGLHKLSLSERQRLILTENPELLSSGGLTNINADSFIENAIGVFALPIGVATNFIINDIELLIPMVTEEPSIIAAASNAARLSRSCGGFRCECEQPVTTCEILTTNSLNKVSEFLEAKRDFIWNEINYCDPLLLSLGGGLRGIDINEISESNTVLLLHMDVRDAMGANTVNTAGEKLSDILKENGFEVVGTIITNSFPQRTSTASVRFNIEELTDLNPGWVSSFMTVAQWAEIDPMRAVTHNKGIMNGVCAVLTALGNDTRATEAAAHFRAVSNGKYRPLSHWKLTEDGYLEGVLSLPVAGASIGGLTSHHPLVSYLKNHFNFNTYKDVCCAAACCGLANNFAAILAISTVGIQKGHMKLHQKKQV
ncbi:hydroxymethylglutaryl-CoA reductase, degradative [Myxococcota bacterium]|nr:hydroxymethylglutaryl-CoA reductase, degradative [Myxococcota bacterium]MBU1381907.1 hydroxymethylglutaryl-CoA reductase, degradative [Myxococcota bacterium]MBU1497808.1 hydroxymethylglutaryl-CoA reductase, degradative [Myxococcota bacterium]